MLETCVCGHTRDCHVLNCINFGTTIVLWCNGGCSSAKMKDPVHEFKLDNLSYIEQIAKERNLI